MKSIAWTLGMLGVLLAVPVHSQLRRIEFAQQLTAQAADNGEDYRFLADGRTFVICEGASQDTDGSVIAYEVDQRWHADLVENGFTRIADDDWVLPIAREWWQ
jgi:hypothetical protein